MIAAVFLIFAALAVAALVFVCRPLWRSAGRGRHVLAASLACLVLAIACGTYVFVGHPELASRSFEEPKKDDVPALVSTLAWRMRNSPNDPRGWVLLGKGYLTLNDPSDAAQAFRRAALLAPPQAKPEMLSAYGEALTMAAGGEVTDEARDAFENALKGDPKDFAARFYLGQAYAERRDTARALAYSESLLADTPPNAPWRDALVDRIAILKGAAQRAPNIGEMVQGLADRLKSHPDDPAGWRRLVRAYVVLGQNDKAQSAFADGERALVADQEGRSALEQEARELKLEK